MTIVGIDLGTTNSLIGVWLDGEPTLIPNALGNVLTPSVVGIDDGGELLVGEVAKERLISHPEQTISNFKRWMGTARRAKLGDKEYLPEELSALVLRSLVRDAERFLDEPVSEAVISVPAYFSDAQRKATKAAGQLAGLKVERIINEPTAAALAYGLNQKEDCTTLIFDLGGGTFDVTMLEQFDDVIEVHASSGDNYLGGEDFKQILINHLVETHKLEDNSKDPQLAKTAEQIKIALTTQHEVDYQCRVNGAEITGTLSREKFEELAEPLLVRIRQPLERVIRDSGLELDAIDHIVLAGGGTRIPAVRHTVGTLLQKLPLAHLNPDEIVGMGAAVQAGLKERNEDLKDVVLTDICPFTLGTEATNSEAGFGDKAIIVPIIERNATIPISRSHFFEPGHRLARKVTIGIFQGESLNPENNIKLGEMTIPLGAGLKAKHFEVRFTYDINGILEVEAQMVGSDEKHQTVLNTSGTHMSDEEIAVRLKELADVKLAPWDQEKNRHLLARADRLYEERTGEVRELLTAAMGSFRQQLNSQSLRPNDAQQLRDEFKSFLDSIDQPVFSSN